MPDYTPDIYVAVSVTLAAAAFALVLRLYARRITKAGYSHDDFLAVVAFVRQCQLHIPVNLRANLRVQLGSLSYNIVTLIWSVNFGLGRPIADGPKAMSEAERIKKARIMVFCTSVTYTFAIAFAKLAILMFYWRIFKFSTIRLAIRVLLVLTVSWFLLRLFLVTLRCVPIQALWDDSIKDAKCKIDAATFFFSTILTHVILDVAILVLPVVEVAKLRLAVGQKVAVISLFMFGALVCFLSIFVLIQSRKFDSKSKEVNLQMGDHTAWAVAEVNLAVVSASLPLLRPILRKVIPGSIFTTRSRSKTTHSLTQFSRGIKLTSIAKTKSNVNGESGSTHELAYAESLPSDMAGSISEIPCGREVEAWSPGKTYETK
ncbi:hypothetical protein LB504_005289, partial [Fusarium proliferatum]